MRRFRCTCGNTVYFENDCCLECGRSLAFDPAKMAMRPLAAHESYCASHASPGTCNWLSTNGGYCFACRLNEVVPDLGVPRRVELFAEVERAKRRLLFTLFALRLPVEGRSTRPDGLAFRILADARLDGGTLDAAADEAVLTGHAEGSITINLLEADPYLRERMRARMNEPYRTLLGHFRHESGHYYWRELVVPGDIAGFRALFGDERLPYRESMEVYYRDGPRADWSEHHVAAYAASHPWEDFAECWAHYLHICDTLETAADAGLGFDGKPFPDPVRECVAADDLVRVWQRFGPALNDLNRSMGLPDAYPFALPPPVQDKLRFVHELIRRAGAGAPPCP